jgi:predicted  nucleic acid-binding Zn-ribbon protein
LLDRELRAAGVAEKLQANEELLYSGRVTNPRELSDLQRENEYLKRRQAELEDRQIEAMLEVDELTAQAAVNNERYVVVEAAWRDENTELSQEYDTLRHELAQLLAQRKTMLKHIAPTDMDEYDAIRRLRKGVAVVAVRDGMCRSCNVSVPQRDLERAQQTDELFYCSGCERILYVADG